VKAFIQNQLNNISWPVTITNGRLNKKIKALKPTSNNQLQIIHTSAASNYYLKYDDFYSALESSLIQIIRTGNKTIDSDDLKSFVPSAFDDHACPATAHSCNRAAFFALLLILGIARNVTGGVKGAPYAALLFP